MPADPSSILLSVPFGEHFETANSPRYHWDNARRGKGPFVIIQLTLEGEGAFEYEGVTHPVREESAFIAIVPETSRYYYPKESTGPWKVSWLNFYGELGLMLGRRFRSLHGPVLPLPKRSPAYALFKRLTEMAESRGSPDLYERSATGYRFLMEWSRQLSAPGQPKQHPVERAVTLCAARFREPLGVKELAANAGLTREHFTRLFVAEMGISPALYLRDLRLKAAREMLVDPTIPLHEVALRCGFPSVKSLRKSLL